MYIIFATTKRLGSVLRVGTYMCVQHEYNRNSLEQTTKRDPQNSFYWEVLLDVYYKHGIVCTATDKT